MLSFQLLNLLCSSCRQRWFRQTPLPAWRRSLCFWRCSGCGSQPCLPPGWWSLSAWSHYQPAGWQSPRLSRTQGWNVAVNDLLWQNLDLDLMHLWVKFNKTEHSKRQTAEKKSVTHQVLSCTHQSSHCQPVSKWHRRRQPWWRFAERQSNLQSTLSKLQLLQVSPLVLLFCSLLLCMQVGGAKCPIGSGDPLWAVIGYLNWVMVLEILRRDKKAKLAHLYA